MYLYLFTLFHFKYVSDFAYGGSIDWTLGAQDVMFSYAFELPGGGSAGFNPPPSKILPVVTETWEAIKVFADNIPDSRGK